MENSDEIRIYPLKDDGRGHAQYSPSASKTWMDCTAYIPLVEQLKSEGIEVDSGGEAAKRGTIMHAHAEYLLREHKDILEDRSLIGDPEEHIWLSPHQWRPHLVPYVRYVRALIDEGFEWGSDVEYGFESKSTIYGEKCWGSVDAWVSIDKTLHVIDLKTGGGLVDVEENSQMMLYAYGLIEDRDIDTVFLNICQVEHPLGPLLRWRTTPGHIREHREKAVEAIESKEKKYSPGKACTFCPGRKTGRCDAQKQVALSILDTVEDDFDKAVQVAPVLEFSKLSAEGLEALLDKAPMIEALIRSARKEAVVRLLDGSADAPKAWKVIEGRSSRRYRKDLTEKEIAEQLEAIGMDPWARKLVPMSEAEAWAGKGKIDHLLEKPPGKPKLVSAGSKGKEFSLENKLAALDQVEW